MALESTREESSSQQLQQSQSPQQQEQKTSMTTAEAIAKGKICPLRTCPECGRVFETIGKMKNHYLRAHASFNLWERCEKENDIIILKLEQDCRTNSATEAKQLIGNHCRIAECYKCHKYFNKSRDMFMHWVKKTGENKCKDETKAIWRSIYLYRCGCCHKGFNTMSQLKIHLKKAHKYKFVVNKTRSKAGKQSHKFERRMLRDGEKM